MIENLSIARLPRIEFAPGVFAHSRGSSMKTNPIVLSDEEITGLLLARL